jgi:hypothetical protein
MEQWVNLPWALRVKRLLVLSFCLPTSNTWHKSLLTFLREHHFQTLVDDLSPVVNTLSNHPSLVRIAQPYLAWESTLWVSLSPLQMVRGLSKFRDGILVSWRHLLLRSFCIGRHTSIFFNISNSYIHFLTDCIVSSYSHIFDDYFFSSIYFLS